MTLKRHPAVEELVRRRTEGDVSGSFISAPSALVIYTSELSGSDRRAFSLHEAIVRHFSKKGVEWRVEPPNWLVASRGDASVPIRIRETWRKARSPDDVTAARKTSGLLPTGRLQADIGSWKLAEDERRPLEDLLPAILRHVESSLTTSQQTYDRQIAYQAEKAKRSAEHAARAEEQRRQDQIWRKFLDAIELHERLERTRVHLTSRLWRHPKRSPESLPANGSNGCLERSMQRIPFATVSWDCFEKSASDALKGTA